MYDEYRTRVAGTTIDCGTLLSTDYFNSFNEVIMLLGMLPDMPDMMEDIRAWKFSTYEQHFRASGLPFAALAIEAYAYVPPSVRDHFERTLAEMHQTVDEARATLAGLVGPATVDHFNHCAIDYSMRLQRLVDTASAIVHGHGETSEQDAIDAMF
jgi:hypothetical protein